MITAVHNLLYAEDPDRARDFFRDVVGWPYLDAHGGWLIFRTGPSELGVHPTSDAPEGDWSTSPHHEIFLMCDDIETTRTELEEKGAVFAGPIEDASFGRTSMMKVPGAGEMMIYEPRHPVAHDL
jgi:predicted enzyme related to lactoylglutathione lyase